MSDWKARLNQAVTDIGRTVQQGIGQLQAGLTQLGWPPTAAGIGAAVGIPMVSLVTEDGPESTVWRAGGTDGRGNWQFEIHAAKPAAMSGLGYGGQMVVAALARRHTWSWPVAAGDGALVCQDQGHPNKAVCYAWRGASVMWATAWGPVNPPDPRDLATRLVSTALAASQVQTPPAAPPPAAPPPPPPTDAPPDT